MNVSTVTIELSELRTSVWDETDTSDIPVYKECCTPERRRPVKVSPGAHAQVVISDNQWNSRDYCFGVCKKADSVSRSGTGSCWDCLCWLVLGYRVSCLVAIVIKDRLHRIDLYTKERRVCTSRPGLVGDPMTPYMAISSFPDHTLIIILHLLRCCVCEHAVWWGRRLPGGARRVCP